MDSIGTEVGQKMWSAIKAKLMELECYVDDGLPNYIMVMVANRRTKSQMNEDLNFFLSTKTSTFVNWLHIVLKKLEEVPVTNPDAYKKATKRKSVDKNSIIPKKENSSKKVRRESQAQKSDEDKLETSHKARSLTDRFLHRSQDSFHDRSPNKLTAEKELSILDRLGKRPNSPEKKRKKIRLLQYRKEEEGFLGYHSDEQRTRNSSSDSDRSNRYSSRLHRDKSKNRDRSCPRSQDKGRESRTEGIFNRVGVKSKIVVIKKLEIDYNSDEQVVRQVPSVIKVIPRVIPSDVPQPSKNLLVKAVAEVQKSIAHTPTVGTEVKPDVLFTKIHKEKPRENPSDSTDKKKSPSRRKLSPEAKKRLKRLLQQESNRISSSDEYDSDDEDIPKLVKNVERSKYGPECRQGDKCEFVHSSQNCEMFPHCKFGDKCLFLHPKCKLDTSCTKEDCPYGHNISINQSIKVPKMADQDYHTKLESLQKYIPFLVNTICELKAKGNREAQLNKIQSLHDMITDTRKKFKLETLNRCEEVLTNIYPKTKPQYKNKNLPNSKTLPGIDSPIESSTLPGIENPKSNPISPGPTRDVLYTNPVNIQTEKVNTPSFGLGSLLAGKSHLPIPAAKVPEVSKPPIYQRLADKYNPKPNLKIAETDISDFDKAISDSIEDVIKDSPARPLSEPKHVMPGENILQPASQASVLIVEQPRPIQLSEILEKIISKPLLGDLMPKRLNENMFPLTTAAQNKALNFGVNSLTQPGAIIHSLERPILSSPGRPLSFQPPDNPRNLVSPPHRQEFIPNQEMGASVLLPAADSQHRHLPTPPNMFPFTTAAQNKALNLEVNPLTQPEAIHPPEPPILSPPRRPLSFQPPDNPRIFVSPPHRQEFILNQEMGASASVLLPAADLQHRHLPTPPIMFPLTTAVQNNALNLGVSPLTKPSAIHPPELPIFSVPRRPLMFQPPDNPRNLVSPPHRQEFIPNQDMGASASVLLPAADSQHRHLPTPPNMFPLTTAAQNKSLNLGVNPLTQLRAIYPPEPPILSPPRRPLSFQPPDNPRNSVSRPHRQEFILNQDMGASASVLLPAADSQHRHLPTPPNMFPFTTAAQNKALNLGVNPLRHPGAIHPPEPPILSPPRRPLSFQPPDNSRNFVSPPNRQEFIPNQDMGASVLLPAADSQHRHLPTPPNMFPFTTAAQNKALNLGVNPLTQPGAIHPPEPPILSPPRRPLSFQPPDNSRNIVSPPDRQEFIPNQEMGASASVLLPAADSQHRHLPTPPNMFPFTTAAQNKALNLGFNPLSQPGAIRPLEPPILSSPRRPLNFQPPDNSRNFVSPPHRHELIPNQEMGASGNVLLPAADSQHRHLPTPPIPPSLPGGFSDHNSMTPRNQNYMTQSQFQPQPEVNVYNNQLVPGMGYYGAPNQVPLHNPDQNYFQENSLWTGRPGDPRNYKENEKEREAKAQEKQKEIKDPRVASKDSKDRTGEKDVVPRDPRLIRDSVDKTVGDKPETSIKEPRLSRRREKSGDRDQDRDNSIEQDKETFRSPEISAKDRDRESRERAKSRERGISRLRDSSDSKGSRSRHIESKSLFDKMYSRTNSAKSRSPSQDDKNDKEKSFVLPLDSLYNSGEKGRIGRGSGIQTFKIPKKSKEDDLKRKDEKGNQRRSSVVRKKRCIKILDSSDESDANDVDNNSVPEYDSDVESLKEFKFEDLKDGKKKSGKENIEQVKNIKKFAEKPKVAGLDTSRIKVIIKTDSQYVTENELDTIDVDLSNFVCGYDKEFQIKNNEKSESDKREASKSVKKVATKQMKKSNTKYNTQDVQVEEPSSSKDVIDIAEPDESVADSSKRNIGDTFITQLSKENVDVAFKKPTESVEADSSKISDSALTPQERPIKSDELSEQYILTHFFENLLKSNNKKDKKTALFSLIETFSDSFDTKEIQKIRKIIKANDDVGESDKEFKSRGKKGSPNSNSIPNSNITSHILAVVPVQEEQPVVSSTTEEVPVDNDKGLQVAECVTSNEPLLAAETQVNEVTKSSEEIEPPPNFEVTKSGESFHKSNQTELLRNLEPVIVSVGERIKHRRRNLASSKLRNKEKTELDMLQEDIQDMLIRDGVLTATGKRMSRILKGDPTAISVTNPETILEQPNKVRKKPDPKPKPKINKDELQNLMKDLRIVIKKMPDNIMTTRTTRQLRSRNRQSSYADSDDGSPKVSNDLISPHQLRSRNLQSSYLESDDDSYKSNNEIDAALSEDDEPVKSEIDVELSSKSGDEDNKSRDGVPKPTILRRRRETKWASGIIPKNQKNKLPSKSLSFPSRASSPDDTDDSIAEAGFDKLAKPDKKYYYDYANKTNMVCKLCKYSGLLLTGHYLKEHPQSEVLCSRLAPHVATEAIKDFLVNGKKYESIINTKLSIKYHYCCRVCGFTSVTSPISFYEHVTTHTGEYRHQCGICEYFAVTGKTMAGHFISAHPDQEKKATRKTYTLAIVFGYICGECNFIQLKEKSVEDHANIFHLGVKPTIYKISMSTVLDPIFNNVDLTGEELTPLEPKLTDITISSTESEVPRGTTETTGLETRKKSVPKRKVTVQETRMEEENNRESPVPVVRKKPGPKSKTMPFATTTNQNKDTEKVIESPAGTSTEPVVETPPAPVGKKPGPKSKTHKPKPPVFEETPTGDEALTQSHKEAAKDVSSEPKHINFPDESIKEAPVRKRRRSLDKLISEDSGDDLDTIITLSSRSSRATKEKATAKLKTLMESNGGLSTRKKSDTDLTRKEEEKSQWPNESIHEKGADQAKRINYLNQETREKEAVNENQTEVIHPPSIEGSSSEKEGLNVCTCKTDTLEEDAKQIGEERLRTMEELNKSFGSRTSKLDFVDKFGNRLNNDQPSEQPRVAIKQEPKDDYVALRGSARRADTPTMPVLEKELPQRVTSPPLTKVSKSPLAYKMPVLEENNPLPQSSINIKQNKLNSLFSNMIEKLQGKVNEAAVQQQSSSTSSPPLNEETSCNNSPRSPSPELLISIGDLISATETDSEIVYSCHANNCYVVTKDKMIFQLHCKFGHKDLTINSSLCDKCGVVIETTPDTSLLENLYDHLVFAHSDCLAKSSNLRMRRLRDKLSVKQESLENKSVNLPSKENGPQDFESALVHQVLIYLPKESTIHTATAHVSVEEELPTPASQQVPMDAESSIGVSIPTTMPAGVEISNEEPVALEAKPDIAEDNPFSFKIANVVSLAKSIESENQTTSSSPVKNKPLQKDFPPLKPVPPLTLTGIPKQQPSMHQNHLVVKEAKLTSAELTLPKKAPKALEKFVDTPGFLYKCPEYYCMFCTNVRMCLERHLKVHQCDDEVMVPCVYCDLKTPWEHVPMHIDIRHATSRFSCSYCLYRAYVKEYVCLHQEQEHPDQDIVVLALPPHRAAKKFSVADARIDSKILCEPFRCVCRGEDGRPVAREYLFESEFANHLNTVHKNSYTCCGHPGCNHNVNSSMMLNHWTMFHGVGTYQCAYCKTSSQTIARMYTHFSQQHPSKRSNILVRVNDNLPKDRELGYSKEAFQQLCHIRKVPRNLLTAIGKRSKRSIKLIHVSGSSEESTNDDIPESTSTVIHSDSEPRPVSKTDDTPLSKDKDSKTKSVSKTRGLKRQSTTTDLLEEAVKIAKIKEPDDEDSVMVKNCSMEHLISIYGLFGTPHNKQWKCPICQQFKSKRVGNFVFHIYKHFFLYRYRCKACSDLRITYKSMLDHIALHPGINEDIIEALVPNIKLETWIHMVVREQSLAILKNSPLLKKRRLTGPTDISCYFCQEKFMTMSDCCEHMLYHWVMMMPYQCDHCPSEFYTVFGLKRHHKIVHPDLKLNLDPKGPTLTRALQCIENIKKRPPAKYSLKSPSRKNAKVDDSTDTKETNADDDVITSGIVTNRNTIVIKKIPKAATVTPSTSAVDVIRIDDDNDDLVILTNTENTTVPNEDKVFACDACAYFADTKALMVRHLHYFHGIKLTNNYHTLSKLSAETPSDQDMACNICDAVFSELKLRRHFLDNHLETHTFSPYRFKCGVFYALIEKAGPKNKLYSCTMCSYTKVCPDESTMRAHLRGHLRRIVCNYCNCRFRYYSEVQRHNTKEHVDLELDFRCNY